MDKNEMLFRIGPIRPPSEANSLLLQVTAGCTWNKCKFCQLYRNSSFRAYSVDSIKEDIDNKNLKVKDGFSNQKEKFAQSMKPSNNLKSYCENNDSHDNKLGLKALSDEDANLLEGISRILKKINEDDIYNNCRLFIDGSAVYGFFRQYFLSYPKDESRFDCLYKSGQI